MRMDAHASPDRSRRFRRRVLVAPLMVLIVLSASSAGFGQESPARPESPRGVETLLDQPTRLDMPAAAPAQPESPGGPAAANAPFTLPGSGSLPDLTKPQNLSSAMQIIILLTVLSLAPAILLMMTCFTRIIIVLSLLRQALGTQQLPPNQIMIGLAMFMTFLVMGPTWQRVNDEALRPYLDGQITQPDALTKALVPLREFMITQISNRGNDEDALLFAEFSKKPDEPLPERWEDVSTLTLIPAFMLSELKTAFLIGFQVYLPFLVIDMVISIVLISMGMMMLPPVLISLPFKLLLFVLVDGWRLITQGLMGSFAIVT